MKTITIDGRDYQIEQTCGACPEQYEVFKDDVRVAYLRLRHGYFYVAVPDAGGDVIYEAGPKGDGIFDDDEREHYMSEAMNAIDDHYEGQKI